MSVASSTRYGDSQQVNWTYLLIMIWETTVKTVVSGRPSDTFARVVVYYSMTHVENVTLLTQRNILQYAAVVACHLNDKYIHSLFYLV